MIETTAIESSWSRRLLLVAQVVAAILGAVIVIALPFEDLVALASSPQGLGQGAFWAWVVALWLAASPVALALSAAQSWRRGYRARRLLAATWTLIALAAVVHWDAGGSWAELLARPAALALMLWMMRPLDPHPHPGRVGTSDDDDSEG
ncbi:hypothetical protein [Nonomuraea sp. NPDC003804]|uniref:hypothetical protein n=1 Tax=Nonomuraea sp. NPDC003804 TaxID=3154547 RepID=UPI0033A7FDDD